MVTRLTFSPERAWPIRLERAEVVDGKGEDDLFVFWAWSDGARERAVTAAG